MKSHFLFHDNDSPMKNKNLDDFEADDYMLKRSRSSGVMLKKINAFNLDDSAGKKKKRRKKSQDG